MPASCMSAACWANVLSHLSSVDNGLDNCSINTERRSHSELQLQMSTVISNHQPQQLRGHHNISLSGHKSSLHLGAFEEQLAFRSCMQLPLLRAEKS